MSFAEADNCQAPSYDDHAREESTFYNPERVVGSNVVSFCTHSPASSRSAHAHFVALHANLDRKLHFAAA